MIALSNFHSIRPPFETMQLETFDWFIEAHCQAELTRGMSEKEASLFREELRQKLWRVGCKPGYIEKRGHILADFLHRNWDKMDVYRLIESPNGKDLSVRSKFFEQHVDGIFEAYYPDSNDPPADLIHVSCTGYVSPSGAQKLVSKRGWGIATTVTHAYHMGCYGAFPAIRMGAGFLKNGSRADIVHTEICCLHSNPSLHQIDQLVSQSLFADGFIKYTLSADPRGPHFKIIAIHEEIIPDSSNSMTWNVVNWGFQMTLSKELPVLIARALKSYLARLCKKAGLSDSILSNMLFAIHPGGPKILDHIQNLLSLSDQQMAYSCQILKNCGNMSSATLPHIWEAILADPQAKDRTNVVSLAFGPGLSISGAIMEKSCGF